MRGLPRLREVSLGLSDGRLKRPPINREQKITRLHRLAVLKVDGRQVAGDARPHLHGLESDEAADILVLTFNHPGRGLGNRHLRRWRVLRLRLALLAPG
jgi:hypothetical protein